MELEVISKDNPKFYDDGMHLPPDEKLTWEEDGEEKNLFVKRLDVGRCMVYLGRKFVFLEDEVKLVNKFFEDWMSERKKDRLINIDYFMLTWKRKQTLESI